MRSILEYKGPTHKHILRQQHEARSSLLQQLEKKTLGMSSCLNDKT